MLKYFLFGFLLCYFLIEIKGNCYIQNNSYKMKRKIIKTLVRQAARWSTASLQDENVMIAVLHANYGAGYLWALLDFASDKEIKSATGLDAKKIKDKITKVQDKATMRMAKLCPKYAPKKSYLTKVAGEGN